MLVELKSVLNKLTYINIKFKVIFGLICLLLNLIHFSMYLPDTKDDQNFIPSLVLFVTLVEIGIFNSLKVSNVIKICLFDQNFLGFIHYFNYYKEFLFATAPIIIPIHHLRFSSTQCLIYTSCRFWRLQ